MPRDLTRAVKWISIAWVVVFLALSAPAFALLLPAFVWRWWVEIVALALMLGAWSASRAGRGSEIERRAEWMLCRGIPLGLGAFCLALVGTWLPHYLFWPWSRDTDAFAMLARQWDTGILPYRDVRGYNFPGHIYLHWLLGHARGWGRPIDYQFLDAAALLAVCGLMLAWSRRRLGAVTPGLVAVLILLGFYLELDFEQAAQRDGHVAMLGVAALLMLETWPTRLGRVGSGLLFALALTIRPHALAFLPALLAATLEGGDDRRARLLASRQWCVAAAVGIAMGFAPLVLAGILDDLARGLRIAAYGGPYSRATPASMLTSWLEQFRGPRVPIQLTCALAIALVGPSRIRPMARTWTMALLGVLLYRPLHPVEHDYLGLPLMFVLATTVALPIGLLLTRAEVSLALRALCVLLAVYEALPGIPRYSSMEDTLHTLVTLAKGRTPASVPPGAERWFSRRSGEQQAWDDYARVLEHIRRTTGPDTVVANVVRCLPFEPINGPTGRLSPFRAESGICFMWLVNLDLEPEFVAQLESAGDDTVVVWTPRDFVKPMEFPRLAATIERLYRIETQFGMFETRRRRVAAGAPGP